MTALALAHARRVVVVGASTRGCAFALRAAGEGHTVTLVDEHPQTMAQMALDAPYHYGAALPSALANGNAIAQAVLESNPAIFACVEAGVDVRVGTIAWGAFQNGPNCQHVGQAKIGIVSATANELIDYDDLILATGMRDFVPSFRGSELPGVFGVKAGVALLDQYQCYEGKRTLVLGTSRQAFDFVKRAMARGVEIIGMVEPGQAFAAGIDQATEVAALGIPVHFGHVIIAAEGTVAVNSARLQPISGGPELSVACDSICAAIGVLPNIELAAAMGCRLQFDAQAGAWLPVTDRSGQTSLEGVLWLSDVTGGATDDSPGEYFRLWIKALLDTGCGDVTLCKCESVSRHALLGLAPPAYLQRDLRQPHSPVTGRGDAPRIHQDLVKRMTRVGMGHCQGKRCRDEAALLLSIQFGIPLAGINPGSYRFPVRPLDLSVIAAEDDTYDTREKWSYWLHEPDVTTNDETHTPSAVRET